MIEAIEFLLDGESWTRNNGLLEQLVQQLLLTVTALALAVLIGLPIALWLGHIGRGGLLAINISNIGRAVPTFALLAVLLDVVLVLAQRLLTPWTRGARA